MWYVHGVIHLLIRKEISLFIFSSQCSYTNCSVDVQLYPLFDFHISILPAFAVHIVLRLTRSSVAALLDYSIYPSISAIIIVASAKANLRSAPTIDTTLSLYWELSPSVLAHFSVFSAFSFVKLGQDVWTKCIREEGENEN